MTYEHFLEEYRRKLRTPEEAVSVVKDGDWVDYTCSLGKPEILDRALAKRRDELFDVKIRGNLISGPIAVAECVRSILLITAGIVQHMSGRYAIVDSVIIFRWYFIIMQHIMSIFLR